VLPVSTGGVVGVGGAGGAGGAGGVVGVEAAGGVAGGVVGDGVGEEAVGPGVGGGGVEDAGGDGGGGVCAGGACAGAWMLGAAPAPAGGVAVGAVGPPPSGGCETTTAAAGGSVSGGPAGGGAAGSSFPGPGLGATGSWGLVPGDECCGAGVSVEAVACAEPPWAVAWVGPEGVSCPAPVALPAAMPGCEAASLPAAVAPWSTAAPGTAFALGVLSRFGFGFAFACVCATTFAGPAPVGATRAAGAVTCVARCFTCAGTGFAGGLRAAWTPL
jgi:hypothetical protein